MKNLIFLVLLAGVWGLSACVVNRSADQSAARIIQDTSTPSTGTLSLNTSMGEFLIASTRLVDAVNGVTASPEEKILLVVLTRPGMENLDQNDFSLEAFQTMIHDTEQGEIYILGDDGSKTISTMAGWVEPEYKEFAMGFLLPASVSTYQLYWQRNDAITLNPTE